MVGNNNPLIYLPSYKGISRAKNKGERQYKAYLRSCGSNFIARREVREFVLTRDNNKCDYCGKIAELQIDHIVSIYRGWKENIPLNLINHLDNLQTLCRSCNSRKEV